MHYNNEYYFIHIYMYQHQEFEANSAKTNPQASTRRNTEQDKIERRGRTCTYILVDNDKALYRLTSAATAGTK